MNLWRPLNLLQFSFVAFWTFLWISFALVVRLITFGPSAPLAMARRIWAPGVLTICGARLEIRGLENLQAGTPYLFAVNHQSQVDIPAVFRAVPRNLRFLVKEELRRIPVLSWYIAAMGMVFIDRKDGPRALKRMEKMTELLEEGACFVTFPEGSRSPDSEIHRFKSGALLPALEARVEVVPVALEGADRVLPPRTLDFRPGTVRVSIGKPISVESFQPGDRRPFADHVEGKVRQLFGELREESGGPALGGSQT